MFMHKPRHVCTHASVYVVCVSLSPLHSEEGGGGGTGREDNERGQTRKVPLLLCLLSFLPSSLLLGRRRLKPPRRLLLPFLPPSLGKSQPHQSYEGTHAKWLFLCLLLLLLLPSLGMQWAQKGERKREKEPRGEKNGTPFKENTVGSGS